MQDKKKMFEGMQKRAFEAEADGIRLVDDENRIVELSFSSETPVRRYGASEVLSHKSGAVMLERINNTGCVLFNHDWDRVVGKVIKAKIEKKRGVARVQFDTDADSDVIFQKVKSGTLRGVSVGYYIHEHTRSVTGKGEELQVTYTATKWEPIEISIVSVPADISVGIGRSMAAGDTENIKMLENQFKVNQNIIKSRRYIK